MRATLGVGSNLTTTIDPVSMTQRTTEVDERIAAMRLRIADQLLHIQRLNVLGRDTSNASEVLELMLSAFAQMQEVRKTIRALRVS